MNQAVLYTNYGAQYVFCKNSNLYFSEIQDKPKNLSPVLVSGAESFNIFYESDGRLALFLKTRKDTWTKMLIVKNRLMYYGNDEGSFSMSDVNLLGYCSSRKELYLFSPLKSSIIKINTENGKSGIVEENAEIFGGGVYYYGSKTFIAYVKGGRLFLIDTQNERKMIISENARNVKDMSLCINNGKIYVLMIVNNVRFFNLELYPQGERPIHILRLRSAKNCIITSNNGTLNIGVCDNEHIAFMRSENNRAKFSPVTEKELSDIVKVNYISLDPEFSASHVFTDSSGRLIMPNVLSPEIKAEEETQKEDDITVRLKNRLSILETELKNKEDILKSISTEYSQKQINDGKVISLLRKSLEEVKKKNAELMQMLSQFENEKMALESQKNEIMKVAEVMIMPQAIEKKSEAETPKLESSKTELPKLEATKAEVLKIEVPRPAEEELETVKQQPEELKQKMEEKEQENETNS